MLACKDAHFFQVVHWRIVRAEMSGRLYMMSFMSEAIPEAIQQPSLVPDNVDDDPEFQVRVKEFLTIATPRETTR